MSKDIKPSKKNPDRETYSFMVNNKSSEGRKMIAFLEGIKADGGKVGNYVKKLILNDMQNSSNETTCTTLSNALLLEKLEKQEVMLKNLTNIIEAQNRDMSLLHTLLSGGVAIGVNTNIASTETAVSSENAIVDEEAEHEAFLSKAKKAIVAPDLCSVTKNDDEDNEDSIQYSDDNEDAIEYDNEDEDDIEYEDDEDDIQYDEED